MLPLNLYYRPGFIVGAAYHHVLAPPLHAAEGDGEKTVQQRMRRAAGYGNSRSVKLDAEMQPSATTPAKEAGRGAQAVRATRIGIGALSGGSGGTRRVMFGRGADVRRLLSLTVWQHWLQTRSSARSPPEGTRSPRQLGQTIRLRARSEQGPTVRGAYGKSLLLVWRAVSGGRGALPPRAALSTADGVSCRARAERLPLLPSGGRIRPMGAGSPVPSAFGRIRPRSALLNHP